MAVTQQEHLQLVVKEDDGVSEDFQGSAVPGEMHLVGGKLPWHLQASIHGSVGGGYLGDKIDNRVKVMSRSS